MQASMWLLLILLEGSCLIAIEGLLFYPRKSSFGYLAAVAMPLDLGENQNVYVSFNFESNYALPSNDTYNEWIDRWNLDQNYMGVGNNVTAINGRSRIARYTRSTFYHTIVGYLEHFQLNGSSCLLRTICEVSADQKLDEHNGLLGTLIKILFMPSTSRPETNELHNEQTMQAFHEAELHGKNVGNCQRFETYCNQSILNMISDWLW